MSKPRNELDQNSDEAMDGETNVAGNTDTLGGTNVLGNTDTLGTNVAGNTDTRNVEDL